MTLANAILKFSDQIAGGLGLLDRPFDPDELIKIARKRTGLTEFGDTAFIGPLSRLLNACANELSLSIVGRSATRWDVVRFLSNLLWLQRDGDVAANSGRTDPAADLYHWPAKKRHHFPASPDALRYAEPGATGL